MVRPRKREAERRSRTICVRVATEEAAKIAERAGAARLTKGGYIRRRALGEPVREAAVHRLGARERVELHRTGVNLNQIARALNSGGFGTARDAGGGRARGRTRGGSPERRGAGPVIPKINGLGCSFAGVAAYCLHDRAGREEGRKLAQPVLHYSLSWARDETPDRREMNRVVDGSLKALGRAGHKALSAAHDDTRHPHIQAIANRVNPETGKAAKLGNSKFRLSRWVEGTSRDLPALARRLVGRIRPISHRSNDRSPRPAFDSVLCRTSTRTPSADARRVPCPPPPATLGFARARTNHPSSPRRR